jgi:Tfp pilus assembly protein PilV
MILMPAVMSERLAGYSQMISVKYVWWLVTKATLKGFGLLTKNQYISACTDIYCCTYLYEA